MPASIKVMRKSLSEKIAFKIRLPWSREAQVKVFPGRGSNVYEHPEEEMFDM